MDKKPFRASQGGAPNKKSMKNAGFIALLVLLAMIVFAASNKPSVLKNVSLSDLVSRANRGEYSRIVVKGGNIEVTKKGEDKPSIKSHVNQQVSLKEEGVDYSKVTVDYQPESSTGSTWLNIGASILPVVIISFVLFFILRSAQGQGNQALSFGKGRLLVSNAHSIACRKMV